MIQPLIDSEFCWRLSMALVHSLWQLPAVVSLAWLIAQVPRIRRSAESTHGVYVVALAVALLAMPLTLIVGGSTLVPTGHRDAATWRPHAGEAASVAPAPITAMSVQAGDTALSAAAGAPPEGGRVDLWTAAAQPGIAFLNRHARWIALAYFVGLTVMLLRLYGAHRRSRRLRGEAVVLSEGPVVECLQRLARAWLMQVVPQIGHVETVVTPIVVGIVRPMILLPTSALSGLTYGEIEMILAHELAHIRRRDMWIHYGQRLAEAIYFFHPAVWILSRKLSLLREFCCDEAACRAVAEPAEEVRLRYVTTLVRVVEGMRPKTAAILAGVAASGRSPSELRRRIARLLGESAYERFRVTRGGWLGLVVAASLLVVAPLVAESQPAAEKSEAATAKEVEDANVADLPQQYTHPIIVFGRALDEEGEPIAGATIHLSAADLQHLAKTTTDEEGRYRFEDVPLPIERADTNEGKDAGRFEVFGTAPGYALAWRPSMWMHPTQDYFFDTMPHEQGERTSYGSKERIELDLRFKRPSPLRGRVVDDQGKPLAGTRIAIRYCDQQWDRKDYNLVGFEGSLTALNARSIVPAEVRTRVTDAEGRFEFTELPADYRWQLDVRPPGQSPKSIWAVTRELEQEMVGETRVYSGDFEVVFPRQRPVKFKVVYADTGEPAVKVGVGATVTQAGFWETTDEQGMIEAPLAKGTYDITVSPRYGTSYLRAGQQVNLEGDEIAQPIVLKLQPAAVVAVTVVDDETGEPLEGADCWTGGAFLDRQGQLNQRREVLGWRSWEVETRISHYERPRSDKQGKMRALLYPGTYTIGVGLEATPPGYAGDLEGQVIECEAGKSIEVEFRLKKAEAVPEPTGAN